MNFNKLTIKASEAIQEANSLCINRGNNEITTEHLFFAMLEQADGYLPLILKKMGKQCRCLCAGPFKAETIVLLDKLPRIQGTNQIGLSSELNRILEQSEREMKEL